jgi:hypothetical protein
MANKKTIPFNDFENFKKNFIADMDCAVRCFISTKEFNYSSYVALYNTIHSIFDDHCKNMCEYVEDYYNDIKGENEIAEIVEHSEFEEYFKQVKELEEKKKEYQNSIAPLLYELDAMKDDFTKTIEDLESDIYYFSLALSDAAKRIVATISKETFPVFGCIPDCTADVFDLTFELDEHHSRHVVPSPMFQRNACICELVDISNGYDGYARFVCKESFDDGNMNLLGKVGIPLRYFETNILYDKEFLCEMFNEIKKRENQDEIKEKEEEIAKLQAKINALKE